MDIELFKKKGAISRLREETEARIHRVRNGFDGAMGGGTYVSLSDCIQRARSTLDEIEILLKELNAMDGVSK